MPKAIVPVTWRLDPALYAGIRAAAQAAGLSVQTFACQALAAAVEAAGAGGADGEDRGWLEAEMGGEWPPYDWGPGGPPAGRPVRWVSGRGLVVEGGRDAR